MSKIIFCIDLHGVLVNSDLMIGNYEKVLINLYSKYSITPIEAIKNHNLGLKQFREHFKKLKSKNLTGNEFLTFMDQGDKEWDRLMQNFVPNIQAFELESRNVEYLAGKQADVFYPDGKEFLVYLQDKMNSNNNIDFFIVSDSHTSHITGLLEGAGLTEIPSTRLLGWDKIACLKHQSYYYNTLARLVNSNKRILIGNSKNEMVLGKKSGFNTIFISREFSENLDFKDSCDLIFDNLESLISNDLENIFS